MSEQAHIQTLFAYHWDTTDQLIAGAGKLSAEQYAPLHATLFHLLRVNHAWRHGLCEGGMPTSPLNSTSFPTRESLAAGFAAERQAWDELLSGLDDAQIDAEMPVIVRWMSAEPIPMARWRMLHQVLMHGMQHHAELAQLLTAAGHSPGNIDFIFYREH